MEKSQAPQIDAQFWDQLFTTGNMPWDRNQTPKELAQFLSANSLPSKPHKATHVFIPGCGAAYEVKSFIEHGYQVIAMDYSQQAVSVARSQLGQHADAVQYGDVFSAQFAHPFEIIYERAFLAALPRDYWQDYFKMVEQLLPTGGLLVGYFVISDDYRSRFPPFCLQTGELTQRLGEAFKCITCSPVIDSVAVFADKEYWMIWQKR
ncbi:thiopurine S-methyltransferase [Vibrio panuliri]|uniref:Thiopurine S-methyltransferase n=1 Tax=Vibrio panuliri TaxID=1381081 RepID=A0A1Q9HKR4_9VIBR|nr:methyltransferase domain-containing protein [Vibrio panuliri]OLQ90977.1 thiopurine S-methyltransferase [Vibrio panuliri]